MSQMHCWRTLLISLFVLAAAGARAQTVRVYPVPPEEKKDLACWNGMLEDAQGRIYVSSGDHVKENGDSWLHRFDPRTETIQTILDVRRDAGPRYVGQPLGHGKIHVRPLMGPNGRVYVSTYYGAVLSGDHTNDFQGSLLFSFDPQDATNVTCHGVIFPHQGTVGAELLPERNLYACWVQPAGRLMVYDLAAKTISFQSERADEKPESPTRLCAVDRAGRVYFQFDDHTVWQYDPATGQTEAVPIVLPSARSLPADHSRVYRGDRADYIRVLKPVSDRELLGVTCYGLFFLYHLDTRQTEFLGSALDRPGIVGGYYVADFALNAADDTAYYVGGAIENKIGDYVHDNPVIAYHFRTGEKRVLVRLNQVLKDTKFKRFRYNYGVLLTRDQKTLYLCPNVAGDTHVALVRIELAE